MAFRSRTLTLVVRWLGAIGVAAASAAACSLPSLSVPPYDADASASDDAAGGDAGATGDSSTVGALHPDGGDASVADGGGLRDATGGLESGTSDATLEDTGADATVPDAGPCVSQCVGYVVSDVTGQAGTVTIIATSPLAILDTIQVGRAPTRIALTPDGAKAYVTNSGDGTVSVIDTSSRQVVQTIEVATPNGSSVRGVTVSPDGRYAYVSDGANNRVVQIDTSTDTLTTTTIAVASTGPYGVSFTPDGGELWAGGAGGDSVARFSYPPFSPLGAIAGAGANMLGDRIVFRPDFSAAFVTSGSGCPCCGELEKVSPDADAATYVGPYYSGFAASGYGLVMSADGTTVYATSEATPSQCSVAQIDGELWALDATTDTFTQLNIAATYDEPRGLALAASGTTLLVAGYDTGGATPGVAPYYALTLTQSGPALSLAGLPQDIAVAP